MRNVDTPISQRPSSRPYQEYVSQQQRTLARARMKDIPDGSRLWQQMMIGFTCAGFVGLVMLVLGTVFIAEAISRKQPITVMLCVMGIVFGIIIIMGTVILGKLLISRKWVRCQGNQSTQTSQCFHTCSVIYSPSMDQLGVTETMLEAPPTYDSVVAVTVHSSSNDSPTELGDATSREPIMILPPTYDDVTKPLPEYNNQFDSSPKSLPPYSETDMKE